MLRAAVGLLLIGACALAAGCQKAPPSGGPSGEVTPPVTPPSPVVPPRTRAGVTLTVPPPGAGVAEVEAIRLEFTERMRWDTVREAFRLQPSLPGHFTYDETGATYFPMPRAASPGVYAVSLAPGALTANGEALPSFTASFTLLPPEGDAAELLAQAVATVQGAARMQFEQTAGYGAASRYLVPWAPMEVGSGQDVWGGACIRPDRWRYEVSSEAETILFISIASELWVAEEATDPEGQLLVVWTRFPPGEVPTGRLRPLWEEARQVGNWAMLPMLRNPVAPGLAGRVASQGKAYRVVSLAMPMLEADIGRTPTGGWPGVLVGYTAHVWVTDGPLPAVERVAVRAVYWREGAEHPYFYFEQECHINLSDVGPIAPPD
ncbi:MAG: hypothetical protein AB1492_06300 [Bacillota bacterium]